MDLGICGILDIVLIVGLIGTMVFGYFQGFMKKILSIVGIISILVFSIVYCGQFANWLIHKDIIAPELLEHFTNKISTVLANKGLTDATAKQIAHVVFNIPKFLSGFVVSKMGIPAEATSEQVQAFCANFAMEKTMTLIAFGIIFVGLLLILGIAKLIATLLRKNQAVRVVDGIFGILISVSTYIILVSFLFYILSKCMNQDWFSGPAKWLIEDMQLDTNKFRISKAIYESNIFASLLW